MPSRVGLRIGLLFFALVNMVPVAVPGVASEDSWGILVMAVAAAAVSCLLCRPSGERRVPRSVIYLLVLATVGHLLYEMLVPHAEPTVYLLDLAHFLMLLCCCKFFELRSDRDMGVTFLISFLLVVIAAFVSAGIQFGIVVAIDATLGVCWLMAFQARRDANRVVARRRAAAGAARPLSALPVPELDPWPRRGGLRATSGFSLALIAVATCAFIVVPRGWGRGLFGGMHQIASGSVTGFTDEVHLDDTALLENSAPVMRVRFFRNGELITGDDFQPYMRGQSFDRYYEGRWRRTPTVLQAVFTAGTVDSPAPLTDALDAFPPDRIIEQRVWLENTGNAVLFSMYPPLTFGSADIAGIHQDRLDLAIQPNEPMEGRVQYVVHSALEKPPATGDLEIHPRFPRDGHSTVPARVKAFARDLAARFGDPTDPFQHQDIARRIGDFLRSGEFAFTLDRGASTDELDPVEDFLFVNKQGHCEYFASAMTLLCQAVGIRARLVGGYHGGEFNPVGGFYQFRQSDAHAWVEVYLLQEGWALFDPSPPAESRAGRAPDSLLARAHRLMDFLEFKWATLVIAFDADTRTKLTDRFTKWFGKLQAGFRADGHTPDSLPRTVITFLWGPELLPLWQRVFYWLLLVLCAALVLLTLRVMWILSLMAREALSAGRRAGSRIVRRPEARFYDRLLLLLSNKGHVKPAHLTPREFALTLARSHADFAELPRFTDWFYQAQYGHRRLDRQRWERLKAFLQRLREDTAFGVR